MRLAILTSHPIQYQAPLFREIAKRLDLIVMFAHRATPRDQAAAGFGVAFDWDVDLLAGYRYRFLQNVSRKPGISQFGGCDTPSIAAELSSERFDALLVMGWHLKCFVQAALAARANKLPVMVRGDSQLATPRGPLKLVAKALLYPWFLRLFNAGLYVGKRSFEYYRYYHYPEERLFFSPHCVDNAWFAERATIGARQALRRELGIDPDEKVILFAGKLIPIKRPLDVIEAGVALIRQGMRTRVLVAGTGPIEEEARVRAKALGLPVHLLGFRNQTQMPSAYAAADVLVLPSKSETWGLVANEALACGRPIVVSSACGCAPDLGGDSIAGRVFPQGDVGRLAKVLGDILASPPLPDAIRAKSEAYGLSAAAAGIVKALDALTEGRHGVPGPSNNS